MLGRRRTSWSGSTLALVLLVLQPLLVKAPLLLGILKVDPRVTMAGLGSVPFRGLGGTPTIDPNIALTSHALGTLAARSVFAGGSLWWNPYEGVGAPLAGEMQSAALFPLTWLMILPNGQLIEHLLFQIIAGCATFLLLRRLRFVPVASWFGATAFAFNGTFAWLANAVVNPICFLPVILLGVEYLRGGDRAAYVLGGLCVSLGIAASLYAGFPETAYLDGLFAAGWAGVRLFSIGSGSRATVLYVARIAAFGIAGVLIAAPILLAFVDYLPLAYLGIHNGSAIVNPIRLADAAMMLVPYLPGALSRAYGSFWGSIGGYAGFTLAVLAAAGCWAARDRALRFFLGTWTVLALAAIYGIPPLSTLINWFPGVGVSAVYRYVEPSLFMALAVLAGFALDGVARAALSMAALRRALLAVGLVAAGLIAIAVLSGIRPSAKVEMLPILAQVGLILAFVLVLAVLRVDGPRRAMALAIAGAFEIVLLFVVPLASYPLDRHLELRGVQFLQRNLGNQRFVSLGEIGPPGAIAANYGSYFGIGQVNWNDLPTPRAWVDYVRRHIEPAADPIIFRTTSDRLLKNLPYYAAIGTRYVTVPIAQRLPGLREVFADPLLRIYEVPDPRPYFAAPGCVVVGQGKDQAVISCSRAARLERLELMMPGWTATVNGRQASIGTVGEIFQAVDLPPGRSTAAFTFQPPGLRAGLLLAAAGLVLMLAALVIGGHRQRAAPVDERWAAT